MNSQRNQIILAVVLAIVLVGVVYYQFVVKAAPTTPAKPKTAAADKARAGKASSKAADKSAADAAESEPSAPVDIYALLASIKEVDFDYSKERVPRDVMAPLVNKVAVRAAEEGAAPTAIAPATLGKVMSKAVSGIVWDETYPVAVVDNEVVEPGYEYADGTAVDSIQEDYVVFRVGESLIQVELKER